MGSRAGLNRCGKSRPPPGFDPLTVQPVASRYTDYATRPKYVPFFSVALRPNAGHGLLILDVSRSHTTTQHSR